jgi:hypothetical protein
VEKKLQSAFCFIPKTPCLNQNLHDSINDKWLMVNAIQTQNIHVVIASPLSESGLALPFSFLLGIVSKLPLHSLRASIYRI